MTTLPAEVVRRLGLPAGQELHWIEDGLGGFRVVPHSDDLAEALEAHEAIMDDYDSVFRELAKRAKTRLETSLDGSRSRCS